MQIAIDPHQIFKFNIFIILFLACMHAIFAAVFIISNIDYVRGISHLFRMDFENNVPTMFSGFILLLTALFALAVFLESRTKTNSAYGWLIVSVILVFLCVDEIAQIHEKFSPLGRELLGLEQYSNRSAWFVVYAPLPFLVVLLLWKWFWNLPRFTQIGFVVAGGIFLSAALGIEIIQVLGNMILKPENVNKQVWFQGSIMIEESLEMLGVAVALRTVLLFVSANFGGVYIGHQTTKKIA